MCAEQIYDIIVVGGGVAGTGIARDAAMRGIKVLLVEKNDLGAGTSGISSGMIQGGPRYLLSDPSTTEISCIDSGYIRNIAKHLVFRIPFVFPIFKEKGRPYFETTEAFFELYDHFVPLKEGKPHCRLSPDELHTLEPGISGEIRGAISLDEWGIDPLRLCLLNLISACLYGAQYHGHTEVTSLIQNENRKVLGIKCRDSITGQKSEYKSKVVINASGPWSSKVALMAGCEVSLRPTKGIHVIIERRLSNIGIVTEAIDGRIIFIYPHENVSMIGATDDDYYGDLDDVKATEDEVSYLIQGIERIFPSVRKARAIYTIAGIRPTLHAWGNYEDNLSRAHRVFDHESLEGVSGFITVTGGKLASHRLMAQEVVDIVARRLGNTTPCQTHTRPLPGQAEDLDIEGLSRRYNLPIYTVNRMVFRHGTLAQEICERVKDTPHLSAHVCYCEPVTEAEICYAVENEFVRTLSDLMRRTRLGMGPCQGTRCAMRASQILAHIQGNDAGEILREFLKERWKARAPVLSGKSVAQEELNWIANWKSIGPE